MLMWLSEQLIAIDPGFAVFQYLTLRGILAAGTPGDLNGGRSVRHRSAQPAPDWADHSRGGSAFSP